MQPAKRKTICPHCNVETANEKVCTNLDCGKRLTAPVKLFARAKKPRVTMSTVIFGKSSRPITIWDLAKWR